MAEMLLLVDYVNARTENCGRILKHVTCSDVDYVISVYLGQPSNLKHLLLTDPRKVNDAKWHN